MQNEIFTFEIDSEFVRKCFRRLYTVTGTLKLTSRPFAIDAIFKTPQSNREMRAAMPHCDAAGAPAHLPCKLRVSKSYTTRFAEFYKLVSATWK